MPVRAGRQQDRRLIQRAGRSVLWQQAVLCPNLRDDGQHDYTCTDCSGSVDERGYLFSAGDTIKGLFHGDSREERFDMAGAWEKGRARVTIEAHREIGDQDRLVVQDLPTRDSLQLVRGGTSADILRQPHVVQLLLVRDATTIYTLGTDYQLSTSTGGAPQPQIEWLSGGVAPTVGSRYVALMTVKPVWIVDGHPMIRGWSGKKKDQLPKVCDLKRDDVAVRGS